MVGGGVFGGCSAYELAKAGADVVLIERDPIGTHASGRNPGNLNPLLAAPPGLREFALTSFRLHEALERELSSLGCIPYGVEPVRRLLVCYKDDDREALAPIADLFIDTPGFAANWLDRDKIRKMDPRLAADIESGLLLDGNRSLDARKFNHAVVDGAVKHGARLMTAEVRGITRHGSQGYSVHTDHGDVSCDALVLTTGPWVGATEDWLGLKLPVEPVKGEMLRVRLRGDNIAYDFTHGMISLYRRVDGEIWIGVTREKCGFDEAPTPGAREHLLREAARIMPSIAGAEVLEHLASLRPMAPGGLPLIGPVPGLDRVYVANGGGIKGMLTCAGVGRAIRDLVLGGRTDLPVDDFAPRGSE